MSFKDRASQGKATVLRLLTYCQTESLLEVESPKKEQQHNFPRVDWNFTERSQKLSSSEFFKSHYARISNR